MRSDPVGRVSNVLGEELRTRLIVGAGGARGASAVGERLPEPSGVGVRRAPLYAP